MRDAQIGGLLVPVTTPFDPVTGELAPVTLRANARDMAGRAGGKPIRLASKSVRCRTLVERVLRMDGFRGIMAFTLPEALWLAKCGSSQDILVAYPTVDTTALARLAGDPAMAAAITVMVDCTEHLDLIERAAATVPGPAR